MAKSLNRATIVTLVVLAALLGHTAATTYVVGGSRGWAFANATTYPTWASQYTFIVGDVLVFNFTTNFHTVATVTKASFDTCNFTNPISLTTNGPANITLSSPGEAYFVCTIGQHCAIGSQKLAINVTASSSSPPASPPSSLIPKTPSPTPAPPSAATRLGLASIFSIFISMGVCLLF